MTQITFRVTLTPDAAPIWGEIAAQADPPAYLAARLKAGIEDGEFEQVQVFRMEEPTL